MESLNTWFAENGSALWTTIISFMSVYGVALVSLVIGIIKTKLAAIAAQKASDATIQELTEKFTAKLDEMEKAVIEASNVNTEKRMEAMQKIAESVALTNEALQEANTTDANAVLDSLE